MYFLVICLNKPEQLELTIMIDKIITELISEVSINSLAKLNIHEISIFLLKFETNELQQKSLLLNNKTIKDFVPINNLNDVEIISKASKSLSIEINNFSSENYKDMSEIAVPIVYNNLLQGFIYAKQYTSNYFNSNLVNILSNISSIFAIKLDKIQSDIVKDKLSEELLEQVKINQIGQIDKLFEVTIDGIIVVDEFLKTINLNNIAESIFGWSALDIIGKNLTETLIFKEKKGKQDFINYFNNYKLNFTQDVLEFTIINKFNKEIEIAVGVSQTHYQNNLIFILYLRDNTERKKAEEYLKLSKENAEKASKSKTDFLANMSHEIRTPMNAIIGFSELLYSSLEDEEHKSQINIIRLSAKNLLTIINDILDFSKIEAGKMELQLEKVNLYNLVKEVELILNSIAKEKNIKIYLQTEKIKNYLLMLDSIKLKQIFFNLIGNSIKFTEKGHIIISIDIINNYDNINLDLFFSVEDTGVGIPEDQLDYVFEKFSQKVGQDAKSFGGTGLGLPISKNLVELMGGELKVKSNLGVGSIFSFYLPNVQIFEINNNKHNEEIKFKKIIFNKAKILIADDLVTNRQLIKEILINSPFEVFEADNGQSAINIAISELPDLVLMDLKMPIINGYEVTKYLKQNDKTKHIPIIAVSASAYLVLDGDNGKNIFDDYITKPIDFNKFFIILKKYLKEEIKEINLKNIDENPVTYKKSEIILNSNELNEIIIFLENKIQPRILTVIENQMIDEIEKIGNDLVSYGRVKTINIIVDYGKNIINFANNFEVNKLIDLLNKFPELINSLKKN